MSFKDTLNRAWDRLFGPKLRCKPGDVCLIVKQYEGRLVRGDHIKLPTRMGIIVEVVSHDGKTWAFKEPLEQVVDLGDCTLTFVISGIADEFLQPLPKLDEPAEDVGIFIEKGQGAKTGVPA